ncbi:MAG: hypothetical protein ACR2NS_14815 [Gemmatimonadaceae bacterium]
MMDSGADVKPVPSTAKAWVTLADASVNEVREMRPRLVLGELLGDRAIVAGRMNDDANVSSFPLVATMRHLS